jgi:hypothetical protein
MDRRPTQAQSPLGAWWDGGAHAFLSDSCPPMGIYETLYAFRDSFGQFMGTEGTHPWSPGFPLTTQLIGR